MRSTVVEADHRAAQKATPVTCEWNTDGRPRQRSSLWPRSQHTKQPRRHSMSPSEDKGPRALSIVPLESPKKPRLAAIWERFGWCAGAAPSSCWRRAASSVKPNITASTGINRNGRTRSTTSTSGSYVVASCWSSGSALRGADRRGVPAVSGSTSTRPRRWRSSRRQAARPSYSWCRSTSTRPSAPWPRTSRRSQSSAPRLDGRSSTGCSTARGARAARVAPATSTGVRIYTSRTHHGATTAWRTTLGVEGVPPTLPVSRTPPPLPVRASPLLFPYDHGGVFVQFVTRSPVYGWSIVCHWLCCVSISFTGGCRVQFFLWGG